MDQETERVQQNNIVEVTEIDETIDTTSIQYDCVSYTLDCPEGKMYFFIDEDRRTHLPVRISAFLGKSGSPVYPWLDSFCRLASMGLERGFFDVNDLRALLSNQSSDRSKRNVVSGVEIRSGPEAIYVGLSRYVDDKFEAEEERLLRIQSIRRAD